MKNESIIAISCKKINSKNVKILAISCKKNKNQKKNLWKFILTSWYEMQILDHERTQFYKNNLEKARTSLQAAAWKMIYKCGGCIESLVTHLGHLVLKIFSIEVATVTGRQIGPALTNIDIWDFLIVLTWFFTSKNPEKTSRG